MANKTITGPKGFRVAAVRSGIKDSGNFDLGLIIADEKVPAAAMFTTNKIVAPAVVVSREHIRAGGARAVRGGVGKSAFTDVSGLGNDLQKLAGRRAEYCHSPREVG